MYSDSTTPIPVCHPVWTHLLLLIQIRPHPVLEEGDGAVHGPVPGEAGAQGLPDGIDRLALRSEELGGVVYNVSI